MRAREMKGTDTVNVEAFTYALAQKLDALVKDCVDANIGVPVMPVMIVKASGRNYVIRTLSGTVLGDGTPAVVIETEPTPTDRPEEPTTAPVVYDEEEEDDLRKGVVLAIEEALGIDHSSIEDKESLRDDLNFDHIDEVEVTLALEEKFHIEMDDDVVASLKTVGDLVRYVRELTQR